MTLVFHNQPIINKGETLTSLYKLVKGNAVIIDQRGFTVLVLKSPSYLNLPEIIYDSPAIKTVRAEGRCEVLKVRAKDIHKKMIKTIKDNGLRKNNFPVFEVVPSANFYSLMHFAKIDSVDRGHFIPAQKGSIYLIIEGSLFVSKDGKTKLLKLDQGQTLMVNDADTSIFTEMQKLRVGIVSISTSEILLGQYYQKIKKHGDNQRELLSSYQSRNNRLTIDFKRSREGSIKSTSPLLKDFTNKIEAKVERFDQYKRARSCFASCRLDPQEIRQENQQKYLELIDLNRKKFGQEYVYRKRLEVSRDVHSLTHARKAHSMTHKQLDLSIYEVFSLKAYYGVMKRHPEMHKKRKQGLVRRTAALKKSYIQEERAKLF